MKVFWFEELQLYAWSRKTFQVKFKLIICEHCIWFLVRVCALPYNECVCLHSACVENLSHERRSRIRSKRQDVSQRNTFQIKYYTTTLRKGIYCAPCVRICHRHRNAPWRTLFRSLCAHRDAMKPKCSTQLELLMLLQLQRFLPRVVSCQRKWAGTLWSDVGWGSGHKSLHYLKEFSFASFGATITAACMQLHITLKFAKAEFSQARGLAFH